MSAAASTGEAGLAGAAAASIFGVSISGDSPVMLPASPVVGRTLAADRHPLNRPGTSSHNILDAGHRSGKVRSSKARCCARHDRSGRNRMTARILLAAAAISALLAGPAGAQEALVTYKSLSPELASRKEIAVAASRFRTVIKSLPILRNAARRPAFCELRTLPER